MVYIPFNQSTLSTGTFPGASVKVFDIPRLLRDIPLVQIPAVYISLVRIN